VTQTTSYNKTAEPAQTSNNERRWDSPWVRCAPSSKAASSSQLYDPDGKGLWTDAKKSTSDQF
jgi:hypothetical protein